MARMRRAQEVRCFILPPPQDGHEAPARNADDQRRKGRKPSHSPCGGVRSVRTPINTVRQAFWMNKKIVALLPVSTPFVAAMWPIRCAMPGLMVAFRVQSNNVNPGPDNRIR